MADLRTSLGRKIALVVACTAVACVAERRSVGSGVDPGPEDGGGTAQDATPSGTDTGVQDTDTGPAGACDNEADKAGLQAPYGSSGKEVTEIAANCAVQTCLFAGDFRTCVSDCVLGATNNQISAPCVDCVAGSVECARSNCVGACLSDPAAPACLACQCGDNSAGVNCRDEFNACAGITRDTCAEGP